MTSRLDHRVRALEREHRPESEIAILVQEPGETREALEARARQRGARHTLMIWRRYEPADERHQAWQTGPEPFPRLPLLEALRSAEGARAARLAAPEDEAPR